jgi:hypothetical protein
VQAFSNQILRKFSFNSRQIKSKAKMIIGKILILTAKLTKNLKNKKVKNKSKNLNSLKMAFHNKSSKTQKPTLAMGKGN